MTTGIQIVWWIGLIGALIFTLVILRLVELVVRSLRDIHRLAVYTRDAAQGIEAHVKIIPELANVAGPVDHLLQATAQLAQTSAAIRDKADSLVPGSGR